MDRDGVINELLTREGGLYPSSSRRGLTVADTARVEWEIAENHEVREFTLNAFKEIGYGATDSQTNFVWVNVRRPSKEFREVCFELGVLVGRDFPPAENSHSRISLGSMDEMRQAMAIFRKVLVPSSSSGA